MLLVFSWACTRRPVRVVVAATVLTTTSWIVSGRPRQFIVMCENSLCSILFHPGGRWHTVMVMGGAATWASLTFTRQRQATQQALHEGRKPHAPRSGRPRRPLGHPATAPLRTRLEAAETGAMMG